MRDAFFNSLEMLMSSDKRVVFITADLGFKLFDRISGKFPDRVVNVGIRESAMVGLAAGLSKEGFLPFLYSIAPFSTSRCLEQIRVDLCYNNLPAVIVGVGGGLVYDFNGPTHMGIDDVGVMSALPNMMIISPCDPFEVKSLLPQIIKLSGPVYLRLARNGEPDCRGSLKRSVRISYPCILKSGRDAVIFSYGPIINDILRIAKELETEGRWSVKLVSCHTIKPLDDKRISGCLEGDAPVIVIEEHVAGGGLGSHISLSLARNSIKNRFFHLHLSDSYPDVCGDRMHLLELNGLSGSCIKKKLSALLDQERG